jgi:hypothetical protein
VPVFGSPVTAGHHTRRDLADRRSQAPRAPQKCLAPGLTETLTTTRDLSAGPTSVFRGQVEVEVVRGSGRGRPGQGEVEELLIGVLVGQFAVEGEGLAQGVAGDRGRDAQAAFGLADDLRDEDLARWGWCWMYQSSIRVMAWLIG